MLLFSVISLRFPTWHTLTVCCTFLFHFGNLCGHFDSTPCDGCTLYGIAWRCSRSFCISQVWKNCEFFFGTDLIMGSSGEVTQGSHGFTQVGLFIYFFISCCLPPLCVFGHLVEYTGIGILVLVWFFACILRPMFAP